MIDMFDLLTLFSTANPEIPFTALKEAPQPSQSIASPHCNTHGHPAACTQTLSKDPADVAVVTEPLHPQTAQCRKKRRHDHPLQQ
jgi:hypothetical protein